MILNLVVPPRVYNSKDTLRPAEGGPSGDRHREDKRSTSADVHAAIDGEVRAKSTMNKASADKRQHTFRDDRASKRPALHSRETSTHDSRIDAAHKSVMESDVDLFAESDGEMYDFEESHLRRLVFQ